MAHGDGRLTSNGETTDSLLVLELEAKLLSVVAQSLDTSNLEVDPSLAVENLGAVLDLGSSASAVAVETGGGASETDSHVDGSEVGLLGRAGRLGGRFSSFGCLRRVLAEALEGNGQQSSRGGIEGFLTNLLQRLSTTESLTSEHCCVDLCVTMVGEGGER